MSDANRRIKDVSSRSNAEEKSILDELEKLEAEEHEIFDDIEVEEIYISDLEEPEKEEKRASVEEESKELVFLYDDDDRNPNYNKEAKEKGKQKNSRIWKKVGVGLASAAGGIFLVYLAFALYFNSHFYFFTQINGNNFSAKSIEDVEKFMEKQVEGYQLTLQKNDNSTETIVGKDISLKYSPGTELEQAVKSQNPFLWPKAFFKKDNLEIQIGVKYDRDVLVTLISKLDCVADKNPVKPESAVPVFDGNTFVIQKEVLGNVVDEEAFTAAIEEHLNGFLNTLNMEEKGCYLKPVYFSDSQEVLDAQKQMNQYLKAEITYDFVPYTEVVDKKVISEWIAVDDNMKVFFHKKKVKKYIENLAAKYNTSGKPRSFVTANGNTVEVKNGIYGWKINQDEEYKKLVANIKEGQTIKREPVYSRRAVSHKGNDFGNTYAEVDLTAQKMWFIKDGKIVLESPIVTGKPSTGHATPQGTYTVSYTQKGAVLRGRIMPDGTREYESPVDYWMPFNGGIGFHDASWQSSFGGNRYLTHGSHGCVNMPLEKAEALFGYLRAGTPVICHY